MPTLSPLNGSSGSRIRRLTRPLARLSSQLQHEWRQRRTEHVLNGLPAEIRKDIGWPTGDPLASDLRHPENPSR